MESFTHEQRQAFQMMQAAAQQVQQSELDRARGARRTEAGMTGKPIPLNRTGGNWEEFNL